MPAHTTWPPRPTNACQTCHHPQWHNHTWTWPTADRGYQTCNPCCQKIRDQLTETTNRYTRLDPTPTNTNQTHTTTRHPNQSTSPANDHIITMTDPRSKPHPIARDATIYHQNHHGEYTTKTHIWYGADGKAYQEDQHPTHSIPRTLTAWAHHIAHHTNQTLTPNTTRTVPNLATWIDRHLDWLTRQPEIVHFANALRALLAQLNRVTGEPRITIGRCPNTIDNGHHTHECGAPLKAPLHGDTVRCQHCGRTWPRAKWLELGELLAVS